MKKTIQTTIENKTFDEERALYGAENVALYGCKFAGEADGESALKECGAVFASDCLFDLRYPLWHDSSVTLENCRLTENCRAALWYARDITVSKSELHGIKALRECKNVAIIDSDIVSPEFGWSSVGVYFKNTTAKSEYFMMRARDIRAAGLDFKGKYSFQYVKNVVIKNSKLDTKDAFWHSKNVTVENSLIVGEYLAWYSDGLTLKNCTIIGTQPLCYCKNLKLIDCVMIKTDLAFERSDVSAVLREGIVSIKNPRRGVIRVPKVGEVIRDIKDAKGKVLIEPQLMRKNADDKDKA